MQHIQIIAEAGVNHNGSIELAKRLIDKAVYAEVDYIKFQTFKAELGISKAAKKAQYQAENTGNEDESQYDMIKKLELSFDDFSELKMYCEKNNIGFLSTGFDIPSLEFLYKMNIDFFKIPSGEITNKPYLEYIAQKGKSLILSTGMANINEVRDAFDILISGGLKKEQISILHCNTEYPTPMEDVNLKAMHHIRDEFGVKIGYSDHTKGIEVPVAAVALGASIIEKHFTLDRTMEGPDHKASLEPNELKDMVDAIRNIDKAVSGSGKKQPSPSEKKNIPIARKSLHYASDLPKGTRLNITDLTVKRPGNGISPMKIDEMAGKILLKNVKEEEMLKREDFR